MAISGTTGVRIPTLTIILVLQVQDAHRAIQAAILGERQATAREAIPVDIHGLHLLRACQGAALRSGLRIQACLREVLRHGEALRFQVGLHC